MTKLKLASPWATCFRQFKAFFQKDPDIRVIFDEDAPAIKIYVEDADKAEALAYLIPTSKQFGNVTLQIAIIPANGNVNGDSYTNAVDALMGALKGNKAMVGFQPVESAGFKAMYILFAREVVSYFNDNLADLNGLTSTLYQDLANEIFQNHNGAFFCTEPGNSMSLGKPLGEWP